MSTLFSNKYLTSVSGTDTPCTYFHCNTTDLFNLSMGNKIILYDINLIPTDVSCNDRHQKSIGPVLHTEGVEDFGRRYARNDKEEPRRITRAGRR